jgi:hypothetical protein
MTPRPEWIEAPGVLEVCSVSTCVAAGPEEWIHHWTHNGLWLFDTPAAASAVVPVDQVSDFTIYAYRLLPVVFDNGAEQPYEVSDIHPEPLPETFRSLGFDVVSRSLGTTFECSPLSCSNMAHEIGANVFCLLPTLQGARQTAVMFSVEQPEPGPYFVVEVLRQ